MSKGKKKENNHKGHNQHYEDRALGRPKQRWILIDSSGSRKDAPKKEAEGAIPVHC